MIEDQGEIALILEQEGDQCKIVKYALPKKGENFQENEVRNVYLAQTMETPVYEDTDRNILTKYLDAVALPVEVNSQMKCDNVRNVFKYKPVALKTRPVVQELPAEFRIKREILGDPLAEMPKLSPNPPDFVPTGRYTQERKDHFDIVHGGDFLLPEERKLIHHFMMLQNQGFAWEDSERGRFREDFFPPIDIPVVPHKP